MSNHRHSRPRRPLIRSADNYFRRPDTALARVLRATSPPNGRAYSHSRAKRTLDLMVSVPTSAAAVPLVMALGALNLIFHPEETPFFRQHRVGRGGHDLPISKIRSMAFKRENEKDAQIYVTRLGGLLRRHFLDELPQLAQVVSGQLSVVGIRILPWPIYRGLARRWSPGRYRVWKATYDDCALGLAGVHQILRGRGKHDERRFHPDLFYARHASLGLDLYILWRTLGLSDRPDENAARAHRT